MEPETEEPGRSQRCPGMGEYEYAAFGLRLSSPVPLALRPDDGSERPGVTLRPAREAQLAERWSGSARHLWGTDRDGIAVSVELGQAGDHRIRAEGIATFLLSADGTELCCATDGDRERDWPRMLDELALPCASLLLGHEALHAGAVALDGDAVAVLAPSGGGKSTLISSLLEQGGTLLSDDVLVLRRAEDRIVAEPGAPTLKLTTPDGPEARVAQPCNELPARPLSLIVVLARGAGTQMASQPLGTSPMPVLAQALSLPSSPARADARLRLYGDLLARTPAVRLVADLRETPARLAALVARAVRDDKAVLVG
jgi:hypothetical protein